MFFREIIFELQVGSVSVNEDRPDSPDLVLFRGLPFRWLLLHFRHSPSRHSGVAAVAIFEIRFVNYPFAGRQEFRGQDSHAGWEGGCSV